MADTRRPPAAPMLTVRAALDFLLAAAGAHPLAESELVPTLDANGRVLFEAQASTIDVPSNDNTQMDGYAVRSSDCAGGQAVLTVSDRIPAGRVGKHLAAGCAARIFTGAMIPDGADAVVMQEQCTLNDDGTGALTVTVNHTPAAGEWIRRAG